jgi:hypothetical protein
MEEYHLLGYNAVQSIESQVTFQSNILPPSSIEELLDACVCASVCVSPLPLLGDNSVKTFLQQRTAEGSFLYAIHIIANERMELVSPRTSC